MGGYCAAKLALRKAEMFSGLAILSGADVTWEEKPAGHTWDFWDSCIPHALDTLTSSGVSGNGGSDPVNQYM